MWKRLSRCVREYKKQAILSPIFVSLEVVLECIIPFIIASLIDRIDGSETLDETALRDIILYGSVLVVMAVVSLIFGTLAGNACATASCGFAKNLRHDLFEKVQTFSFGNIDKFSSASLVTRLTTDVANVQMAFMMIIRVAIRCPLMLVFALAMAFIMGGKMALIFVAVVPLLAFVLFKVIKTTMPLFNRVFQKYDALNESIEENVQGMYVVKSFVREDYEKEKFDRAAGEVCKDFTKAERIVALNGPAMQLCMYAVMVFALYFGSKIIIGSRGTDFNVGKLSALLTYGFQVLSSLMMVSIVFVMITISAKSCQRICDVLAEESAIKAPENALTEVKDGSVDFDGVSFRYSATAEKNALSDI
ncbi:MAG: ABC transporter ATP-binding protein, partial [Clostridia bacterium]|nr:ABC transporter ATP-binding protein [Clostridia bacterium]